jgi:kanosamine-6-phosphate phosphatase
MPRSIDGFPVLPTPALARYIAFSDFDETYLAHAPTPQSRRSLADLEAFLRAMCVERGLIFGWVTGSSLESVLAKARLHGLRVLPHFVASSLATDLRFFDQAGESPDRDWQSMVRAARFSKQAVRRAVDALRRRGVPLMLQPGGAEFEWIEHYYYRSRGPRRDEAAISLIEAVAAADSLGVNVGRCNSGAGDPADCYDVDFLPTVCGKANVVPYICRRYGVDIADTLAFGDSPTDLGMLRAVGRGTLVGNCTADARSGFPHTSGDRYAAAILSVLEEHTIR